MIAFSDVLKLSSKLLQAANIIEQRFSDFDGALVHLRIQRAFLWRRHILLRTENSCQKAMLFLERGFFGCQLLLIGAVIPNF